MLLLLLQILLPWPLSVVYGSAAGNIGHSWVSCSSSVASAPAAAEAVAVAAAVAVAPAVAVAAASLVAQMSRSGSRSWDE